MSLSNRFVSCTVRIIRSGVLAALAVLTSATGPAGTIRADGITIGTGINVTWDRQASPTASSPITLAFGNLTPSGDPVMTAFNLGLRFIPTAGATGTLQLLSASNPASNPLFPAIEPPIVNPQPEGYTSLGILNAVLADVPVPGSGVNAVTFTVASLDALGTFDIVIDGNPLLTGYNDIEANEFAFFNANGTNLTVGQITAVPEPGGVTMAIAAVAAWVVTTGRKSWLRRQR